MKSARTTLPLLLSSAVGLSAVTLMFVAPGEAAPTPSTFSAEVEGEVWRVNRLDLDMSGDPVQVDVSVANAQSQLGSAAAPDRAWSIAHNLVASPTPAGHASAPSTATQSQDTVGTVTGAGQAGTIPSVIDFAASVLTARSRWADDTSCLGATTPLTSSKATSQGAGTVPAAIPDGTPPLLPIPLPTEIPTEIPTSPPSDFPTELPSDLPTILPTDPPTTGPTVPTDLPTDLPTTGLPTLPTDLPTTLVPSVTLPTIGLRAASTAAAEGDVAMATVGAASIEEKTFLQTSTGDVRRVYGEAVGKVANPAQPAMTFFGGEAELHVTEEARLSAYSDGGTNGSQVTWSAPAMTLTVGDVAYEIPSDGTALALPYSQNEDVVLTVSAGTLSSAESPTGVLAQAAVSALNVIIKNGDDVALDAELFPMEVKVAAPQGGIDCAPVEAPALSKPGLTLTGKHNGKKADKVVAKAISPAAGAKVTLYKVVKGKQNKLKSGALNAKGDRAFKVKDKNGKKATKYVVKVGKTDLTLAGKATKKIR